MTAYLFYDCEIIKAIPDSKSRLEGIKYCQGWTDHSNMGISVISYCQLLSGADNPDMILNDVPSFTSLSINICSTNYIIGDSYGLQAFATLAKHHKMVGFNSRMFDDKLMAANGVNIQTEYDLLEEIRWAAYGSINYQDAPQGSSYKLAAVAEANNCRKTGSGENAAIQWQNGNHREVIDYCCNDSSISVKLLALGLHGRLIDPNTGKLLQLRDLPT